MQLRHPWPLQGMRWFHFVDDTTPEWKKRAWWQTFRETGRTWGTPKLKLRKNRTKSLFHRGPTAGDEEHAAALAARNRRPAA